MTKPINILDLRDSPWVDGPGRTVLDTAASLDNERHNVVIGGFCSADIDENIYLGEARKRSLDTQPIIETNALDFKIVGQILAAIDEHRINIVHTHDFRSNLAGLYCARRRGLPVIATCHGWIANNLKGSAKRYIDIKLLSRFDQIVTVSELMKTQLVSRGISARKIEVIVNSLVINNFEPAADDKRFRQELGVADTTCLVLNVGRLSREKGQALLLNAVARVRAQEPEVCLVFVGIGPEEQALKKRASTLGLADNVIFAGYRSDMTKVYNSADLVIQSSFTEGMPNVILESLLMQTPVVATDVGGTAEIVEHGVTGHLVVPNSEQSIVDGIQDFLSNETKHRKMAARGHDLVLERFDHKSRAIRFQKLYSHTLSQGKR